MSLYSGATQAPPIEGGAGKWWERGGEGVGRGVTQKQFGHETGHTQVCQISRWPSLRRSITMSVEDVSAQNGFIAQRLRQSSGQHRREGKGREHNESFCLAHLVRKGGMPEARSR